MRRLVVVVAACCLVQRPAYCQDSETTRAVARQLGTAGVEAFTAGNYASATEKLEKAYRVLRAPSLGLWSGRALAKTGHLVEASQRYAEVASLRIEGGNLEVQRKAQEDAKAEIEKLKPTIPTLHIKLNGAEPDDVNVRLDGATATPFSVDTIAINPGSHRVVASSDEREVARDFAVGEGGHIELSLDFSAPNVPFPAESAAPGDHADRAVPRERANDGTSTRRTLAWVALGGGAVALVVGGVTTGIALSKKSSLDGNPECADDHSCPRTDSNSSLVSSYRTMRTASTVSLVTASVLTVGGVVLLLTSPSQKRELAVWVSPCGAALRGSF
jgi:hypothetical protein